MIPLRSLFCLIALGGAIGSAHSQQTEAYAAAKRHICKDCRTAQIPIPSPKRGVIMSQGNFNGHSASWVVVDLDTQKLSHVFTDYDQKASAIKMTSSTGIRLGKADTARIVALTNRMWASPESRSSHFATDVVWNLYLLDGNVIRKEFGSGFPDGLSRDLQTMLGDIWSHATKPRRVSRATVLRHASD